MNTWMDEEIVRKTRRPPTESQLGTYILEARARYVCNEHHRGQALDYFQNRMQVTALGLAIIGMYDDAHRSLDMYRHKRKLLKQKQEFKGDELNVAICAAMLGVQHKLVHRISAVNQTQTAEEVAQLLIAGDIHCRM